MSEKRKIKIYFAGETVKVSDDFCVPAPEVKEALKNGGIRIKSEEVPICG